ncbi:MAG: hypothetical protein WC404_00275 [Candidatus Omnitrophota bacterium]|jgi:hypothetical protein
MDDIIKAFKQAVDLKEPFDRIVELFTLKVKELEDLIIRARKAISEAETSQLANETLKVELNNRAEKIKGVEDIVAFKAQAEELMKNAQAEKTEAESKTALLRERDNKYEKENSERVSKLNVREESLNALKIELDNREKNIENEVKTKVQEVLKSCGIKTGN